MKVCKAISETTGKKCVLFSRVDGYCLTHFFKAYKINTYKKKHTFIDDE